MSRLVSLTAWSTRRPRTALAAWLAIVLVLAVNGTQLHDHLTDTTVTVSGSPSTAAQEQAERSFPSAVRVPVLLQGPSSALQAQRRQVTERLTATGARVEQAPLPETADRATTTLLLATVRSERSFGGDAGTNVRTLVDRTVRPPVTASASGFSVIGKDIADESVNAARSAELIAIPILLIVLLLVFRAPLAAALPALLGISTVLSAYGLVDLVARATEITDVAPPLTSMLGLALGVDYALLLVSRFREAREDHLSVAAAAEQAGQHAGRTVILAGFTLLATMVAAMALSPGSFLLSAAIGVSAACLMAMLGALLAVPALLVLIGGHLERWRLGSRNQSPRWGAWADTVQRRPLLFGVPVLAALLALAPAAVGLDTGPPDVRVLPEDSRARVDTERLNMAAGAGWIAPIEIVASDASTAAITALRTRIAADRGIQAVLPPVVARDGTAILTAIPRDGPNDNATSRTRDRLDSLISQPPAGAGDVRLGGITAQLDDYRDILSERLPLLIIALSIVALLALVVIMRAIVLPLVSVVLNLVTVGASLGVVALLCTGDDPLAGGAGYADVLALLGMFAIVFALSLDYQIFILAKMRETWTSTGRLDLSITHSMQSTGRVITGAALIMAGVFTAFTFSDLQTVRQPGLGLVTAVIIDATLVRMVLLPAIMHLTGRWTFWLPSFLDRVLPDLDLEGSNETALVRPG